MRIRNKLMFAVWIVLTFLLLLSPIFAKSIQDLVTELEEKREDMINDGFNTLRIDDYISQARTDIEQNDIKAANTSIKSANEMIILAYDAKSEIDDIEYKIKVADEDGIAIASSSSVLEDAKKELLIENYEGAALIAKNAELELSKEVSEKYSYIFNEIVELENEAVNFGVGRSAVFPLREQYTNIINKAELEEFKELIDEVDKYIFVLDGLKKVNAVISDFESKNIQTTRFFDIKNSIISELEAQDIDKAAEFLGEFVLQIESYNETKKLLEEIENKINKMLDADIDVSKFDVSLNKINLELEAQNYVKSKEIAQSTFNDVEELESESILAGLIEGEGGFLDLVKNNMKLLAVIVFILLLLAIPFKNAVFLHINKTRAVLLKRKINALQSLLEETQARYFKKKIISSHQYKELRDKYQEELVNCKEKIYVIEKKIKHD